jgi:hypothetical protein
MMKGHEPVQPGWGNPNHGRWMACPNDPFDGHRGPRATADGAAPTLIGVVQLKVVVDLQGQPPSDGGDVGQRLHVGAQQSNR